ncbi:MAG: transcription-repair coupling factor [Planctomycetaceae bacterium]|nr:transcription-repair coupling factor [Planctomycetaceae bacterium]
MATSTYTAPQELTALVSLLEGTPGFNGLVSALEAGNSGTIDGAWGSASALTSATLTRRCPETLLVVLPRQADLDDYADDLEAFLGEAPSIFPAWDTLPNEHDVTDAVFGKRLRILRQFQGAERPKLVVTTIAALLQPTPSRAEIQAGARTVSIGDELDQEDFQQWLIDRGFERVTGIQLPGEFAVRGGILDLYPPDSEEPIRLEFFDTEVESIRKFDAESQRTVENINAVDIAIVSPVDSATGDEESTGTSGVKKITAASKQATNSHLGGESLMNFLPDATWSVLSELSDLVAEGRQYLERMKDPRGLFSVDAVMAKLTLKPTVEVAPIAADGFDTSCHLQIESIERFTGPRAEVLNELAEVVGRQERVLIACHNEGEQQRLTELLNEGVPDLAQRVTLCIGRVSRGFRLVPQGVVVLSDHELFNRTDIRRVTKKKPRFESRAIDSFIELNEGDLVVHLTHGIGKYHAMKVMDTDDQMEEHLELEFRNNVRVYVPVSLIHLVQKYVGGAKSAPELSLVGSSSWAKKKEKVSEAIADLASDMIRLQAARAAKPGIACPPDSHWQKEFEAAFLYTPTPDQATAVVECKQDFERERPMDRLICGDVGYGKTEVAMRAAFKMIDSGRQVAILVPTTVLAEQHYRTLCERMAEFPITIRSLSRFKTKAQQKKVIEELKEGKVDLVVGTHRLVSKDVGFRNLGLLVIDEEQRFGVEVKEALKHLRLEIDVLTLSATPIPRTLHLSLLGIRDISNLTTPPQERVAVTTRICRFDADLIRQSIVRELNRNGQVFFVHNRVHNILDIAARLEQIVPEARYDVAHGQMTPGELEAAMLRFVRGEVDVLVCTTIVESGVDIPNANTMFIHQADNYGLADLHQLRGRVGRYKHRAYCYLLLEEGKTLTSTAAKRMKAIEEFSELGAGFKIAMRDLEIRGAGNILGTEQSGHIATVGYELYCQLLENAVRTLKKEPLRAKKHVTLELPGSAFFPSSYVPPGKAKIEIYRRLAAIDTVEQLRDFEAELRDRFGPIPRDAARLVAQQEVQILARLWQVVRINPEEGFITMTYEDRKYMNLLKNRVGKRFRIVDEKQACYLMKNPDAPPDRLLKTLKKMLQPFSD